MKEHEVVSLERQNLNFSTFAFCFRLSIFTREISNLLLPLGALVAANLYIVKMKP